MSSLVRGSDFGHRNGLCRHKKKQDEILSSESRERAGKVGSNHIWMWFIFIKNFFFQTQSGMKEEGLGPIKGDVPVVFVTPISCLLVRDNVRKTIIPSGEKLQCNHHFSPQALSPNRVSCLPFRQET